MSALLLRLLQDFWRQSRWLFLIGILYCATVLETALVDDFSTLSSSVRTTKVSNRLQSVCDHRLYPSRWMAQATGLIFLCITCSALRRFTLSVEAELLLKDVSPSQPFHPLLIPHTCRSFSPQPQLPQKLSALHFSRLHLLQ